MRILLIENRSSTWILDRVASLMKLDGNEIFWIVQNKLFKPKNGSIHYLGSPNKLELTCDMDSKFDSIRDTDRNFLHYGGDGNHYQFFDQKIGCIFDSVMPDVVFGEATQFHELLAINHSRRLKKPYLSPSAMRYPPDRMCFYMGDTLQSFGGSEDLISDDLACTMLDEINSKKIIPSYMIRQGNENLKTGLLKLQSFVLLVTSWVWGERYVTPSPFNRIRLQIKRSLCYHFWEKNSHARLPGYLKDDNWVLYPMQMQPEGNIDVWGQPWNNQEVIIERAAKALQGIGAYLVVKPNPKSKYELHYDFDGLLKRNKNIILLSHSVTMGSVFEAAPVTLTVTGTVLLEAIFSQKIIGCLGGHFMSRYPGVNRINYPEEIADLLVKFVSGGIKNPTSGEALCLLKDLIKNSYNVKFGDPIADPELLGDFQVNNLYGAFANVLDKLKTVNTYDQIF